MQFLNQLIKAVLKVSLIFVALILLFLILGFIFFYGTKFTIWNFTVSSIFEVYLVEVLLRYIILSFMFFIVLWIFGIYIKAFRNFKILFTILVLISITFFVIEKPIDNWNIANSVVSDFPNKKYSCSGSLGIDSGGSSCSIKFDLGDKSPAQTVYLVVPRFESKGYKSTKFVHKSTTQEVNLDGLGPNMNDPEAIEKLNINWTSIDDPEVLHRLNQGEKITDAFSRSNNESEIKFSIDPLNKTGEISFY